MAATRAALAGGEITETHARVLAGLYGSVYPGRSRRAVDLGRRTRSFTGALRRAIQHRQTRCPHHNRHKSDDTRPDTDTNTTPQPHDTS